MHIPLMKKLLTLKHKDVLRESCLELQRRGGNFVCIYPALGCDHYDQYFQSVRPLNKFLYKMLFTDALNHINITCQNKVKSPPTQQQRVNKEAHAAVLQ